MKRVLLALAALVILIVPAAKSQAIADNGGDGGRWYNVRCNADGSYDCAPNNCQLFCCP